MSLLWLHNSIIMGTPRLDTCVPVPIEQEELETIVDKAKDWAIMHGGQLNNY